MHFLSLMSIVMQILPTAPQHAFGDRITGFDGKDDITTGAGNDLIVYTSLYGNGNRKFCPIATVVETFHRNVSKL
jgi:hypothetical protein